MHLQESGEMYLETIWILSRKSNAVRSIDVSEYMNFSKPSVSVAMRNLRENGYITVDSSNNISLTPQGLVIAETIYERHTLISNWLISLGVSPETAAEDACRMEHVISAESFSAIKQHVLSKGAPETEESAS